MNSLTNKHMHTAIYIINIHNTSSSPSPQHLWKVCTFSYNYGTCTHTVQFLLFLWPFCVCGQEYKRLYHMCVVCSCACVRMNSLFPCHPLKSPFEFHSVRFWWSHCSKKTKQQKNISLRYKTTYIVCIYVCDRVYSTSTQSTHIQPHIRRDSGHAPTRSHRLTHAQHFAKRLKQKTLIPFAMANWV